MRLTPVLVLTLSLSLAGALDAHAQAKLGEGALNPLGHAMFPVVASVPMVGDNWTLTVAPGLWTSEIGSIDCRYCSDSLINPPLEFSGYSISVGLRREFSERWGVGLVAGFANSPSRVNLGSYDTGLASNAALAAIPGSGPVGGTLEDMSGYAIGLLVTRDFHRRADGFRLPVSVGPFYGSSGFKFSHAFTNASSGLAQTEKVDFKNSFAGVMANVSFDFIFFKKLRVAPGMFYSQGFRGQEIDVDYEITTAGTTRTFPQTTSSSPSTGNIYVKFVWVPWNLVTAAKLVPEESKAYTVTWTKRW